MKKDRLQEIKQGFLDVNIYNLNRITGKGDTVRFVFPSGDIELDISKERIKLFKKMTEERTTDNKPVYYTEAVAKKYAEEELKSIGIDKDVVEQEKPLMDKLRKRIPNEFFGQETEIEKLEHSLMLDNLEGDELNTAIINLNDLRQKRETEYQELVKKILTEDDLNILGQISQAKNIYDKYYKNSVDFYVDMYIRTYRCVSCCRKPDIQSELYFKDIAEFFTIPSDIQADIIERFSQFYQKGMAIGFF